MDLQFNVNFLNHVLLQSIVDTGFLKKIRHVVSLDVFKSKERQTLAKIVYEYFDEFHQAPQEHFYDILKDNKKYMSDRVYEKCLSLVRVLKDINHSNPEYLESKISTAIKHFNLEEVAVKFAELIKAQKHEEAVHTILKAIRDPEQFKSTYINYLEDLSYIERRLKGKHYKMRSLSNGIEKLIGGFNPTWLITILGASKGGKSSLLVDLGTDALMQGLKVLHVTMEMSKEEVEDKYDQCIGFLSSEESDSILETMEYVNDKWVKLKRKTASIYDLDKVKSARKTIKKMGGLLYVADFPPNKANYKTVENLMETLENQLGIIFDVLIVDYLGIMGPTEKGQKKKERIAENTLGLKSIAKDKKVIVFSAAQGNRAAMQAKIFKSHNIADAIEPIFDSDMVLAICQTDMEERNNIYRIYVAEYRHGPKHDTVTLVRDLKIGQMALGIATENLIIKDIEERTEKEDGEAEY